jgi:hypothetical protein
MIEPMDHAAVTALATLPRVPSLAKAREDSIQIFADAQDVPIPKPLLVDHSEALPPRTIDIIGRTFSATDPMYMARLHDVLVTGHRNLFTLDGQFLMDLWNQAGLHTRAPGLAPSAKDGFVMPLGATTPELVDETAGMLFFNSSSGDNHSHWLLQTLPQLRYFELAGVKPQKLVVQPNIRPYQRDMLKALGYGEKALLLRRPDQPIIFRELYVGYVDGGLVPDATIFDRLSDQIGRAAKPGPELVYVSRMDARTIRRLLNEELLILRLRQMGFAIVTPGAVAMAGEIDLFRNARVVVGPLGAGLYNTLFTREGATVLALSDPNYAMTWLPQVAALRRHAYGWLFGVSFESPEPVYGGTHNNWIVDIDRVCTEIEKAI